MGLAQSALPLELCLRPSVSWGKEDGQSVDMRCCVLPHTEVFDHGVSRFRAPKDDPKLFQGTAGMVDAWKRVQAGAVVLLNNKPTVLNLVPEIRCLEVRDQEGMYSLYALDEFGSCEELPSLASCTLEVFGLAVTFAEYEPLFLQFDSEKSRGAFSGALTTLANSVALKLPPRGKKGMLKGMCKVDSVDGAVQASDRADGAMVYGDARDRVMK